MRITPIRTEADHETVLARIDALMGAAPGSAEADELQVLADLVEAYEKKRFPIGLPSPVEAIRFRMEQQGLEPRDLEPYLGSRAKVSEVLSGKRPLTLAMMRALYQDLGIPAEVLLQGRSNPVSPEDLETSAPQLDWNRFPLVEMAKRGWIAAISDIRHRAEEALADLLAAAGGLAAVPRPLCRRNDTMRQNAKTDVYALLAWTLRVLAVARAERLPGRFQPGTLDPDFLAGLAKLSVHDDGPARAKRELAKHGIHLVCVRHLKRTHLDGAALRVADTGAPVVALTLRYDRIDNFWFCLLHELAHVGRHFSDADPAFVDDFSLRDVPSRHEDPREDEADQWAEEALIPKQAWEQLDLCHRPSYARVVSFAQRIGVHPAIVAGRIRYQTKNYRIFAPLLGNREIADHLPCAE